LGLSKLIPVKFDNTELLIGLAAAGYGGTDFLEAFARRMGSGTPAPQVQVVSAPPPTQTVVVPPAHPPLARRRRQGRAQ
jgi:hypothetical protein